MLYLRYIHRSELNFICVFITLDNRKTSIATDLQITEAEKRSLQSKSHKNNVNKREARAIRRKNFLDVCKEAIKMNVI